MHYVADPIRFMTVPELRVLRDRVEKEIPAMKGAAIRSIESALAKVEATTLCGADDLRDLVSLEAARSWERAVELSALLEAIDEEIANRD